MRDPREASFEASCRELRAHTATIAFFVSNPLSQRKINWFGESSRLLEFDRPLTEPGASKLTKLFLATRTAVWNQVSGAPRHRRDIATVTASARTLTH